MASAQRLKSEKAARLYLEMRGFKVLEQNWGLGRNKIDIIAFKVGRISFVEISYVEEGSYALEPLTESKLKKLRTAANAWIEENKFEGDSTFASIDISGPSYAVLGFNENLDI